MYFQPKQVQKPDLLCILLTTYVFDSLHDYVIHTCKLQVHNARNPYLKILPIQMVDSILFPSVSAVGIHNMTWSTRFCLQSNIAGIFLYCDCPPQKMEKDKFKIVINLIQSIPLRNPYSQATLLQLQQFVLSCETWQCDKDSPPTSTVDSAL